MCWRSIDGKFGSVTGELITRMAGKSNPLYCYILADLPNKPRARIVRPSGGNAIYRLFTALITFAAAAPLSTAMWQTNFFPMAAADMPRRFSPLAASTWASRAP
jgi:hypothetical protein